MIVYSFPPLNNPGADRAVSFVRLLHNYGWEPLVLTQEIGASTSPMLEVPVPEGIDIVRTSPWESYSLPGFIRVAAGFFTSLLIPDKERRWELFSAQKAARIAKNEGIDLVYTVSPPSSAHLIGLRLKKKHPGVPWVADLCAARGANRINPAHYEKKLLSRIVDRADCIITGDEAVLEYLLENQTEVSRKSTACLVPDGHVQELSEHFEKACRAIAARKLANN